MNRDDERSRIDAVAIHYTSDALSGANERYHIAVRDALIPREGGKSALELGCGKGLWTTVLCERYDRVDIVDGSRELLDTVCAANTGSRASITAHHALVEDFVAEAGGRWDHIYMTFILEHLDEPIGVLGDIGRLLTEDGVLFVAAPNALSVHRMIAVIMGMIEHPGELSDNDRLVGHRRIYTPELLRNQLTEAGFGIVSLETVTLKPLSLKQMESWSDELVQAMCESGDLAPWHGAYIIARATR